MAAFLENLFHSIFTPGATPTLIVATNYSFAGLQVVLFGLLIATYSIHFLILSFLSAGLWYSINWFVREMKLAQEEDERTKRSLRQDTQLQPSHDESSASEGSETEADSKTAPMRTQPENLSATREMERAKEVEMPVNPVSQMGAWSASLRPEGSDGLTKRKSESDVSATDSEWDKLDAELGRRK